ncbi:hypothetical protein GCM10028803_23680 [Larkinella knui]|uniref:Uncharacterized protein n=1 Tax=Larkinella knui TaxID=2025310 RepID=A0A3P1CX37_9BACT|nr:hypothetical protein [Larkinella knui]RRB17434.1 hypothetical protein EHT87_03880 [Larkinella knui]
MKKIAFLAGILFWITSQGQAQTPSPNAHAPEQASETFPQGDPTAKMDSLKSKLVKGTQSSRNARRSSDAAVNRNTTIKKKTTKTVKTKKTGDPSER